MSRVPDRDLCCRVPPCGELSIARQRAERLTDAILWALGEQGDFPARAHGEGLYWWRTEMRRRAFGEQRPKADPAPKTSIVDDLKAQRDSYRRLLLQSEAELAAILASAPPASCETHGHMFGVYGACVFCNTPRGGQTEPPRVKGLCRCGHDAEDHACGTGALKDDPHAGRCAADDDGCGCPFFLAATIRERLRAIAKEGAECIDSCKLTGDDLAGYLVGLLKDAARVAAEPPHVEAKPRREWECVRCGHECTTPADDDAPFSCDACGGPLTRRRSDKGARRG
jgi:hypothetical protein